VTVETPAAPPSLARRATAALLAWLVPGLGHLYLGRRFKGWAFLILLNGLFLSGWVMSGGGAMSLHAADGHRYAFLAEIGAGAPTLTALALTHREELTGGFDEDLVLELSEQREHSRRQPEAIARLPWDDTGLLYCMIAGLLNMLVIYEAASGGLGLSTDPDKDDGAKKESTS
jgi:TM2 domain-containing membrane protein YozV